MFLTVFLLLSIIPLFLLIAAYLALFRRVIQGGLDYVGNDFKEIDIILKPLEAKEFFLSGKVAVVVAGGDNWINLRIDDGPEVRAFKIRLLRCKGKLEVKNTSRIFQKRLIIRYSV
ncbi:hypothetical protein HS7_11060 [Sulfolobales archaeon HS-7]|nr:hypothetical protein HS7_11060 [Sulfolobales archaeon HS-7]